MRRPDLRAIAALRIVITCTPRVHVAWARVASGVGSRRHSPASRAAPARGRHPTASRVTACARGGPRSRCSARTCDDCVGMGDARHRASRVCGRGRPRGGRDKWSRVGSDGTSGECAVGACLVGWRLRSIVSSAPTTATDDTCSGASRKLGMKSPSNSCRWPLLATPRVRPHPGGSGACSTAAGSTIKTRKPAALGPREGP